jgi:hypothetical protein
MQKIYKIYSKNYSKDYTKNTQDYVIKNGKKIEPNIEPYKNLKYNINNFLEKRNKLWHIKTKKIFFLEQIEMMNF